MPSFSEPINKQSLLSSAEIAGVKPLISMLDSVISKQMILVFEDLSVFMSSTADS